jgi:hypothetical protein
VRARACVSVTYPDRVVREKNVDTTYKIVFILQAEARKMVYLDLGIK